MSGKTVFNAVFILLIMICMTAGIVFTVFFPHDINEYENRYAEKIGVFSLKNILKGDFQDSVELALADQIPYAEKLKEKYNYSWSAFNNYILENVFGFDLSGDDPPAEIEVPDTENPVVEDKWAWLMEEPEDNTAGTKYLKLPDGTMVFNGHLMYGYTPVEWCQKEYDKHIENINSLAAKYPDIDFYAYYIEKESDNNFETGEHMGNAAYILDRLNIPDSNKLVFSINTFANFNRLYYKIDHHWNHMGSYRGYRILMEALLPEAELLEPLRTVKIGNFKGSKNSGSAASAYTQDMYAFEFVFPEMSYIVNGKSAGDYGGQSSFISRADSGEVISSVTYGQFYGQDNGETIIHNVNAQCKDKILLIGESFDNAILKLVASHFDTLYSIDMRNYSAQNNGKVFDFDSYVKENEIDRVVFVGNIDFWIMDQFLIAN